jgi:hypothetical protein
MSRLLNTVSNEAASRWHVLGRPLTASAVGGRQVSGEVPGCGCDPTKRQRAGVPRAAHRRGAARTAPCGGQCPSRRDAPRRAAHPRRVVGSRQDGAETITSLRQVRGSRWRGRRRGRRRGRGGSASGGLERAGDRDEPALRLQRGAAPAMSLTLPASLERLGSCYARPHALRLVAGASVAVRGMRLPPTTALISRWPPRAST